MSSKKEIQRLKKNLDKIQSNLPPEKAAKLNLQLLKKAERDRRQEELDRRRQEERQRFRENIADVALGIASAIAHRNQEELQRQERLLPPLQPLHQAMEQPSVEETLRRLQQDLDNDIEAENNRIINQSLRDASLYQSTAKTQKQELAGAFLAFLISLGCFSFLAVPFLGINLDAIQNLFSSHETNK